LLDARGRRVRRRSGEREAGKQGKNH
jgi:hypothetical protein